MQLSRRVLFLGALLLLTHYSAGQLVPVYDNRVMGVDNGRVNDPDFTTDLTHADRFTLSTPSSINHVAWLGAYKDGNLLPDGDDNFTILFFPFEGSVASTNPIATIQVGAAERALTPQTLSYGNPVFSYSAQFSELSLAAGTYLIAIVNDPDDNDLWLWACKDASPGHSFLIFEEGTPWLEFSGNGVSEFAFSLSFLPDRVAPTITRIEADLTSIWPPDQRMVQVNVAVESVDDRDPAPRVWISEVRSNEPQNTTLPDWEITSLQSVKLRADRSGAGEGRTYTIIVLSRDKSGNLSSDSVDVRVSHDNQ